MTGLVKPKEYNIADSNIANLGSELEKNIKKAAAETEQAWKGAGSKVGLEIWRIEKFKVVHWPKEQFGSFYSGDSYIVLNTYKKPEKDALFFDVHFWLGKYTTQDEAGTAAYKTVELDDFLGGAPVQHREVQGYESELFLSYFKLPGSTDFGIQIMDGGVDSGFKHVEAKAYRPRLMQLKGKKKIRVTEVDLTGDSLNSGDVFVLDAGLDLYQWNGKSAGIMEKNRGSSLTRALKEERSGRPKITVEDEGQEGEDFWKLIGGKPSKIKTAAEGGSDEEAEKGTEKKLFQLSDATGKMEFTQIATGANCKRSLLKSEDVFILDNGAEVFAWIGKGSSVDEKKKSMQYAQEYLTKFNRPAFTPISRILEGGENPVFEAAFK